MVARRRAGLGIEEGVIGDGEHHDHEGGAEASDVVPREQDAPAGGDQGNGLHALTASATGDDCAARRTAAV